MNCDTEHNQTDERLTLAFVSGVHSTWGILLFGLVAFVILQLAAPLCSAEQPEAADQVLEEAATKEKSSSPLNLSDQKTKQSAETQVGANSVEIAGAPQRVVQFAGNPHLPSATLGTPLPHTGSNVRELRPSSLTSELTPSETSVVTPTIVVQTLKPSATYRKQPSQGAYAAGSAQNRRATASVSPTPPSYSLLRELSPPRGPSSALSSSRADASPAESSMEGAKPQSVPKIVSLPPPDGLPVEPWASDPVAPPSDKRVNSLSVPESYRNYVSSSELQLAPSIAEQEDWPPTSKTNLVSLNKPLQWIAPESFDSSPRELLASRIEIGSNDSQQAEDTNAASTSSLREGLLNKHEETLERQREMVKKLVNSLSSEANPLELEATLSPNWVSQIRFPVLRYTHQSELALVEAIHTAIQFAPEIEILRTQVGISRAEIIRQQANFDWNQFVDATWDERNVPRASNLDGVANRLESHTLASSIGLQRQNQFGGQLRLAQDMGFADSNSTFFNPQNQANARIALEYQQPLLQGAGLFVNTSLINIAVADANVSEEEFVAGLQQHVLEVANAYWQLVARRGEFIIQKRNYDRAVKIASVVTNRKQIDAGPVQSARAQATLASRRNTLLQAEYAVVFAQEQLLRLIFGQCFNSSVDREIIPTSDMLGPLRRVNMQREVQVGLQNRPEVRRSIQLIKRSSLEQGIARNQLLPALGLSLSLSNTGLRGNRGLASAIDDQWNFGDPTYGIGISYALPVGNRAAKANLRQAELRIRQFQKELEQVASQVSLEVRNAAHSINLTGKQRQASANAMTLATRELDALQKRAALLLDGEEVGPLYLDNLLQTQDRLAAAELEYLNASAGYARAHFDLQRATGGLLRCAPLPVEAAATKTWAHNTNTPTIPYTIDTTPGMVPQSSLPANTVPGQVQSLNSPQQPPLEYLAPNAGQVQNASPFQNPMPPQAGQGSLPSVLQPATPTPSMPPPAEPRFPPNYFTVPPPFNTTPLNNRPPPNAAPQQGIPPQNRPPVNPSKKVPPVVQSWTPAQIINTSTTRHPQ